MNKFGYIRIEKQGKIKKNIKTMQFHKVMGCTFKILVSTHFVEVVGKLGAV